MLLRILDTTLYSLPIQSRTSCAEAATICPVPCKLTLLTLKVVSESSVTYVPILVFLCLSILDLGLMYATDRRQTDRHQTRIID